MVSTEEVGKLRLLSATPLLQKVSMASNILGIVSAVLDVLKAVDAYRNGEPGVIVAWMGASAVISAISGILAFYALNAWWSFGITLVLAVITIALAILTMQELTLPQRLWVHRSVFGRPNHNYYNSIPFGGDKPRSLPNDPAAADEWKDYQRRALNEEAQALGMLVSGITLEVNAIVPAIKNVDPLFPEWKGAQNKDAPEYSEPVAIIKIAIPENLNGTIEIGITEVSQESVKIEGENHSEKYIIDNKKLYVKDKKDEKYKADNYFKISSGMLQKKVFYNFKKGTINKLKFGFYQQENEY